MNSETKTNGALFVRVSEDQVYLLERLNLTATKSKLSIPLVQKLNVEYGTRTVTDALRYMRGFADASAPAPYLKAILEIDGG